MTKFANYENGTLTINSYRAANATSTDVEDIVEAYDDALDVCLTASIDTDAELNDIEVRI